jgi:hypothetical protein
MKLKNFSTILRAGAMAALFVVGTSASAFALPMVDFTTTGTFSGGNGTVILGGTGVTFTDADGTVATLIFDGDTQSLNSPTNVQYGDILLGVTPGQSFDGNASANFELTVTQTGPTPGSESFSSTLIGTVVATNQSTFILTFSDLSATIGAVTYFIGSGGSYPLVAPAEGSLAGRTTIQGNLVAAAVPEPATMMLLGTGLLAAFRARRKQTTV